MAPIEMGENSSEVKTMNFNNIEVLPKRMEDDDGVNLTWEDLWVTVSSRESNSKAILQGVSGYACPGQVLAIMGPSGCGKSTLLDALAGRLDSNTKQTGQILINGHKQALAYGTSAYVTQDETLMATLTVRESVYYSSELQLPTSMSKSEKRERADECIREMGLQEAVNTRVGGWGNKGLSGGQKRRLSICIEILTHPRLLFLDEPTSGLDSAASFYVMKRIAGSDRINGRTIITSIHQPTSQVFGLFDNLCLLSMGRTVYFGPAGDANQFFTSNGFPCPSLQNPSDHFLQMINQDFSDGDIEQGLSEREAKEEIVNILLTSYNSSQKYQQVRGVISTICKEKGQILETKRKRANPSMQCQILTRRSFVNMHRDMGYYWLRLAVYVTLAFGLGTIFYDLGFSYHSIQSRGYLLMFVVTILTFMTIGGFPSFVEDMKVFKRERLNGHYGVTAFVVGNMLSSMPYLLLISVIPGIITYYLPGLHKGYQHFLYFTLILLSSMLLVEGLMMIIASMVPNFLMGLIAGAGIQGLMMLGAGFFQLPDYLPQTFWRYPMYYISFHKYAFQGLFQNELEGLQFKSENGTSLIYGAQIVKDAWQISSHSKWIDLLILIGMVFLYRLLFLIIIKISENIKPFLKAFEMRPPRRIIQLGSS